jgi:hypothetical protein
MRPRMFIRVVLPEPEGPMIATNSPTSILSDTPCNTSISESPTGYRLITPSIRMAGDGWSEEEVTAVYAVAPNTT